MDTIAPSNSTATALPIARDEPRRRKGPFAWLVAAQLFVALSFVPWIWMAWLTLATFDAGDPLTWVMMALVYGYPVCSIALAVWAWTAYGRGRTRKAMVITTVMFVPAIAVLCYLDWAFSTPS